MLSLPARTEVEVKICDECHVSLEMALDGKVEALICRTPEAARNLADQLYRAAGQAERKREVSEGGQSALDLQLPGSWGGKSISVTPLEPLIGELLYTKRYIGDVSELPEAGKAGLDWQPGRFFVVDLPDGEEGFIPVLKRRKKD